MTNWQPLSVRRGIAQPEDALHEGIPAHLIAQVIEWVERDLYAPGVGITDKRKLTVIASRLRLPVQPGSQPRDVLGLVMRGMQSDEDLCLDVLDLMLRLGTYDYHAPNSLQLALTVAGSAWRVAGDKKSLERRVNEAATDAYASATNAADEVSAELRAAWHAAYGRSPDASDAWDHAIKAVEEVLKPIITPNQPGATLGNIVGQLRGQGAQYEFALVDNGLQHQIDPIDALEKLLHLIWPNPDRHGGGDKRVPALDEAQAVVTLAVMVVQWARSGVVRKR